MIFMEAVKIRVIKALQAGQAAFPCQNQLARRDELDLRAGQRCSQILLAGIGLPVYAWGLS